MRLLNAAIYAGNVFQTSGEAGGYVSEETREIRDFALPWNLGQLSSVLT